MTDSDRHWLRAGGSMTSRRCGLTILFVTDTEHVVDSHFQELGICIGASEEILKDPKVLRFFKELCLHARWDNEKVLQSIMKLFEGNRSSILANGTPLLGRHRWSISYIDQLYH